MRDVNRKILKYVLIGAGGFILFLGLAAYSFRDNIIRFTLNPRVPFQTTQPPPAPDYTQDAAWAARPNLASGVTKRPMGDTEESATDAVSTFFVHTSTYYQSDNWNAPSNDQNVIKMVDEIAMPVWASPFQIVGSVYAPRYRQATLYSMFTHNHDGVQSRKFAYKDVSRAFQQFLKDIGNAPFIIAGHGQGGLHAIGLLQDHIVGKDLQDRFIATYIMDYPLPTDLFDVSLNTLKVCESAEETGCVIAWNAMHYDDDANEEQKRYEVWNIFGDLTSVADRTLTCVNPLTWMANEQPAPNPQNKGGVASLPSTDLSSPEPEITGAQCRGGHLYVDHPNDSRFQRLNWPSYRYRLDPFNMFYLNIRENVITRTEAWLSEQR